MIPERPRRVFETLWEEQPYPIVAVASLDLDGGARVRSLVLRRLEEGRAFFYCHRRHAKREQLEANPRGEICLVGGDRSTPVQLRWRVLLEERQGPERQAHWEAFPGPNRERLYGTAGTEVPEDFMLLVGTLQEIDLVDFSTVPPGRWGYRLVDGQWVEEPRQF